MKYKLSNIQILCYSIILFFALPLKAQVNIGSKDAPHSFSLLELTTNDYKGGLRLPQLTKNQCDSLRDVFIATPDAAAEGLIVYNTDINGIEYWHAGQWVTLCNDKPNITFVYATGGSVDPAAMAIPLAGYTTPWIVPHDTPECIAPPTPPYTVSVKVGATYTHINTSANTPTNGEFSIKMDANTGGLRYAVISVTDSCMNESQDFIIAQTGCALPATPGAITGGTTAVCQGGAAQTYNTTGVVGISEYKWTLPSGWTGASTTTSISATPGPSAVGGNISVAAVNSCGTGTATSVPVTVAQGLTQPDPTPVTICYNTSATLNPAVATGGLGTITYRWESSPSGTAGWTNIAGATGATYTTPSLTTNTYYHRIATAATCGGPITSNAALVTVNPAVVFGTPTPASQTICSGSTPAQITGGTASGGAGSGSYTYQWQSSPNGTSGWTDISGATGPNYTPTALTTGSTYYHRGVISAPCSIAYGTAVTVTVTAVVVPGTPTPTSQTICSGGTITPITGGTASGGAGSGSYTYQWQSSASGTSGWTDISGATGSSYTPTAQTGTTYYHRVVTSGACNAPSSSVSVTVYSSIAAGTPTPASQTICSDDTPARITGGTATGGTGSYTYQWQYSTDDGAIWNNISGATGPDYAPGPLTATTNYRRNVTSGTCGTVSSTSVKITVNQAPAKPDVITVSVNGPIVENSTVGYSVAVVPGATSYVWTLPAGMTIATGSGTNSITVNVGTIGYVSTVISVAAKNDCGTSPERTRGVSLCGANISAGNWRAFMCYDLGVTTTTTNPLSPSQAIFGAKYKWGVKTPALSAADDQNTDYTSGFGASWTTAAYGGIPLTTTADWDMTNANPCPKGYRVPAITEWSGVIASTSGNGAIAYAGVWSDNPTNYGAGASFSPTLYLVAAGYRDSATGGALLHRGYQGYYWSSTASGTSAYAIGGGFGSVNGAPQDRSNGYSVRCIEE